jgi:hypothetical protein
MNFNRFKSFYDDADEYGGEEDTGNAFKTMKSKKKEKQKQKTDDERFKFTSRFAAEKIEKKEEFIMETSAFPELAAVPLTNEVVVEKSFIKTLNTRQEKREIQPIETNSHWVKIIVNKKTGKLTYVEQKQEEEPKPKPKSNAEEAEEEEEEPPQVKIKTEEQIQKRESKEVIRALTNLHMRRTKEYIDAWGKEEHYQTFYSAVTY